MVSLSDVAKAAGVSKSVASRALSDDKSARIKPETAQRVKEIAQKLNYIPNHQARALRSSRTKTIALIVPTVNNAIFGELFAGVQNRAQELDLQVLLGEIHTNAPAVQNVEDLIRRGIVDGAIVQKPEDMRDDLLEEFLAKKHPVVIFNSKIPTYLGSVLLPDNGAICLAVRHLTELGHTRIGFIGGTAEHDAAQRRKKSFLDAMRSAALDTPANSVIDAGWEVDAGKDALATMFKNNDRPLTAIVVASVNAALGALALAGQLGIRVPADLSIIAIHDTWFAEVSAPPLSVIKMPLYEAGKVATDILQNFLDGQPMRDHMVQNPTPNLISRGSTARPPL